ncbi:WhiB family transcriptional regulator [Gordonia malaquae]|uniref:WhiB family transcriptional regulator n=1 Tax=Gordonia malaquae TaxID=410332 RepID=UPI0030C79B43
MSTKQSPALRGSNMTVQPHPVLSPISGMAWVQDRACGPKAGEKWTAEQWAAHDRIWFPASGIPHAAMSVCESCPVLRDCANSAVKHGGAGVIAGVQVPTAHGDPVGRERARRALRRVAGQPVVSRERALAVVTESKPEVAARIRRLCDLGVESALVVDALTGDRPHRRRELVRVLSGMDVPVGVQADLTGWSPTTVGRHRSKLGATRRYERRAVTA